MAGLEKNIAPVKKFTEDIETKKAAKPVEASGLAAFFLEPVFISIHAAFLGKFSQAAKKALKSVSFPAPLLFA